MKRTEIRRQLFHAGVGLLFVALISLGIMGKIGRQFPLDAIYFLPHPLARPLLLILIAGGILALLCRKYRIPGIEWLLENFERPHVRQKFPGKGVFFYALGAFIICLFPKSLFPEPRLLVSASMLIVSVGDPTSHLVGKKYGKVKHPLSNSKNIEGHVAGALLTGLGASLFVIPPIAFIAAFVSMFVEGIEFGGKADEIMDDNLVIPIVSGIVIVLSRMIFF